jgi:hypothetical protein
LAQPVFDHPEANAGRGILVNIVSASFGCSGFGLVSIAEDLAIEAIRRLSEALDQSEHAIPFLRIDRSCYCG